MALSLKKTAEEKPAKVSEKTTMNFARRESGFNTKKMMPYLIVLVIAGALFIKFGFIDPIGKRNDAINELMSKQAQIDEMNTKLMEYDALYEKYGRYSYGWMDDEEKYTIDRMQILSLIEKKIMPKSNINDVAINGDIVTLNLSGITLQDASAIVKALEQDELVDSASVYSATAEDAEQAEIFMSITLDNGVEEVPEAAEVTTEEAEAND